MASIQLHDLLGAYNVRDWGARGDGSNDDAPAINWALTQLSVIGYGRIYVPPGTYRCDRSIVLRGNVELVGFGPASVLQLGPSMLVDLVTGDNISSARLRNLRLDANRANNAGGTRNALWLYQCSDVLLEGLEVVNARSDGIRLDDCDRIAIAACQCTDNGRHGISVSYSRQTRIVIPAALDNCQVESAGVGDGINIELASSGTLIVTPDARETSYAGVLQGYGVREAAAENVSATHVAGGYVTGNLTGTVSLESSDSSKWPTNL